MSYIKIPTEGTKITINKDGTYNIPDNPIITFIEGDGIGPDLWRASVRVFDAAVEKTFSGSKKIVWAEVYAGEKALEITKEWLPKETTDVISEYLISIKGPLTTPVGGGIRSLNVALRQIMDLYACVRPVRWINGTPSPVKSPQKMDVVLFRENTEDVYSGVEFESGTDEANQLIKYLQDSLGANIRDLSGVGIKPISAFGTKRLVRKAIQYAIENNRKTVTLVHKGNIMKFTEGAFKNWGYALAEREFSDKVFTWKQWDEIKANHGEDSANHAMNKAIKSGKLIIKDAIADNFLQQILTRPNEYDVIATMNLNGDYISDALAAQVGGIGIAPGANINYKTGKAIFEATHGTAPKYAGQDKVNPGSVILSGEMMLRYLGWIEAADLIINSLDSTINQKRVTYDFHRQMDDATLLKCSEFGDAMIENMS